MVQKKLEDISDKETTEILDMLERGYSPPQIAQEVGVTPPTMRNRIAALQKKQGVILQYRDLENLRLTELQHEILEHITPQKIADAPLNVLVQAYKILKEKELVITGNPTEIHGLVGYLVQLEKAEFSGKLDAGTDFIEAEFEESDVPNLH